MFFASCFNNFRRIKIQSSFSYNKTNSLFLTYWTFHFLSTPYILNVLYNIKTNPIDIYSLIISMSSVINPTFNWINIWYILNMYDKDKNHYYNQWRFIKDVENFLSKHDNWSTWENLYFLPVKVYSNLVLSDGCEAG